MALLAADIGNAHTVLGLLFEGEVLASWRVSTDERRTPDEWAVVIRGLLEERASDVDGLAVCATVPSVLNAWREMCAVHFADLPRVIVEPGIRTGVPILVDNPREVGSDRIVNAVAAAAACSGPAVVVDFGGTATTYDVIDAQGRYVGGAITPGLENSLEALSRGGAQLRMVELVRPRGVIGKNTVEALQSGMVFGVASQVEGMVARIVESLGCDVADVEVIATGYLARLVYDECRCFTLHDPALTLRGLEMVFTRNQR
ncbi:type III pantothenate kinase [Nocardioides sp. zg-536]|uniref:Type III pantothenate kinase n=1 Tax=Nocardioides faecalis TaxID=2803858 RepID=A0A938Y2N4_9ACTN|nr:type III pantothenate kinase [Nocardioides faecalis]MBM9461057.1 type III pantothenate kinase [Nocardioides faecalis]MBS4752037.1 type III pantothenate kinase [Nocardioides faecalis]QVI59142.1 type III pantothenate kinase [Nocardioides faecalis]